MKKGLVVLIVLVVTALMLGSSFVSRRNQMAIKREAVNAAWAQVDVVLQLQDDVHLRPGRVHRFAFYCHLVPAADKRTSQHQGGNHQNDQDHKTFLHTHLESVGFTNAHSSRAATLVSGNDGPAHSGFAPVPLDTRHKLE